MEKIASLLLPEGKVVLSLDKTRKEDIEYLDRFVPVFPDTPVSIKKACAGCGLKITKRIKKENERKRMEEIKQRVQKQTHTLFADFRCRRMTLTMLKIFRTHHTYAYKDKELLRRILFELL